MKKYYLAILTYFKNERNNLYEWILHYQKWGVQHIYMIDNGSQDDYDLSEFIQKNYITIFKEPLLGQQQSYDKYISFIKSNVHWLGVFDMDEYLYSRQFDNLQIAIQENISLNTQLISIQMTIFFPSTFKSPKSIIESNILRKNYDSDKHPKCIFNLNYLNRVTIHGFPVKNNIFIYADQTLLCINHYRYISFEYLYGIKEGRGGGVHKDRYKNKTKFTVLIENLKQPFLNDDLYLKNKSNDIIAKCQKKNVKPKIELYPNSSWLKLKNNFPIKYTEFSNYKTILNHTQIYDINHFFFDIYSKN